MAWVAGGFVLNVRLVDSGANEVRKSYKLTSADAAAAATDALAVINALEAVSALGTKTYAINQIFINDAFALPAAGVQAEAKAVLVMTDSVDPAKTHITEIPGPETDVFVTTTGTGANIVDVAHADVITYVNLYDATGEATISDGETIATGGILRGYRRTAAKSHG